MEFSPDFSACILLVWSQILGLELAAPLGPAYIRAYILLSMPVARSPLDCKPLESKTQDFLLPGSQGLAMGGLQRMLWKCLGTFILSLGRHSGGVAEWHGLGPNPR